VRGRSLLHLQCHFGMDTLSWARLGARVTGADYSEEAITVARSLAEELDIDARFVCANHYDLPDVLEGEFDIVVTTYGVLSWLPDVNV
jgi:2-polyprenyl-3-methyl-5-hydroxy-6-metoxy-1,4-benzoquinol methylase